MCCLYVGIILPIAVQGDNCLSSLSQRRLSTVWVLFEWCWFTSSEVCCSLHCKYQHFPLPSAWREWSSTDRNNSIYKITDSLGTVSLVISLIPRNTEYGHPPLCHLSATFVQVFIFLCKRCQAHVLVCRESVTVQTVRPGVSVAGEHGGTAVTDSNTHTPTRMDKPVARGNTRLNQLNSLSDNRNYCNNDFCVKYIIFADV